MKRLLPFRWFPWLLHSIPQCLDSLLQPYRLETSKLCTKIQELGLVHLEYQWLLLQILALMTKRMTTNALISASRRENPVWINKLFKIYILVITGISARRTDFGLGLLRERVNAVAQCIVSAGNWIIGVPAANWNPRAISPHQRQVVAHLRTAGGTACVLFYG